MTRHPLVALTVLALLLAGGSAEARFGKRSRKEHEASPPVERPRDEAPRSAPIVVRPAPVVVLPPYGAALYGWVDGYYWPGSWGAPVPGESIRRRPRLVPETQPPPQGQAQGDAQVQAEAPEVSPPTLALNTEAGAYGGGVGLGLSFLAEGQRLGFGGRVDLLRLPTDDGTPGTDRIGLLSLKPSLALVRTERLRLRVMAGLDAAFAPDVTFLGPGVGLQLDVCVLGPLDLEATGEWTPFPFTRLDLQAGPSVQLGPLALRGGWRTLLLNDQGHVDGTVHEDVLSGPYLGVGLRF